MKIIVLIVSVLLSSCASFAPNIYRENKENRALAKSLTNKTVREILKTLVIEPVDSEYFYIYSHPPCVVNTINIKTQKKYIYLKVDAPYNDLMESCKYKSIDFLNVKPYKIIVWSKFTTFMYSNER
ncbi:hypothetical protein ACG95N_03530 [Acinetobacter guillouiae]|uniref:hypothetical protein n=1 Tax=Acinetobacter guillouiae TaxID=106649 RepID=UPI003AF5A5EC